MTSATSTSPAGTGPSTARSSSTCGTWSPRWTVSPRRTRSWCRVTRTGAWSGDDQLVLRQRHYAALAHGEPATSVLVVVEADLSPRRDHHVLVENGITHPGALPDGDVVEDDASL